MTSHVLVASRLGGTSGRFGKSPGEVILRGGRGHLVKRPYSSLLGRMALPWKSSALRSSLVLDPAVRSGQGSFP